MTRGDTMRALLEELAAPAATVIERDGPVCGVCERDIDPANAVDGHHSDCLVMRNARGCARWGRMSARCAKASMGESRNVAASLDAVCARADVRLEIGSATSPDLLRAPESEASRCVIIPIRIPIRV